MNKNVGNIDRGIRGLIGVALMVVFFVAPPASPVLFYGILVVGLVMLATAVFGWCPPYSIFGINTCSAKKDG